MSARDGRIYPACAAGHVWRQDGRHVFEARWGEPFKPDAGIIYWRLTLTDAARQRLERLRLGVTDGSGRDNGASVVGANAEGAA